MNVTIRVPIYGLPEDGLRSLLETLIRTSLLNALRDKHPPSILRNLTVDLSS